MLKNSLDIRLSKYPDLMRCIVDPQRLHDSAPFKVAQSRGTDTALLRCRRAAKQLFVIA
jgi:hypothetical protein